MLTFSQHITELFDKPYAFTLKAITKQTRPVPGVTLYRANVALPDKTMLTIEFEREPTTQGHWTVYFYRGGSFELTGKGDQMKIFSTVIAAIRELINKEDPLVISFAAEKDGSGEDKTSREKLYARLVKKFASTVGYKIDTVSSSAGTMFSLKKK